MSRLSTFFTGAHTAFGVFYPKHYLLALFPDFARAEEAQKQLNRTGRADDEVISVSGDEVVEFAEEHLSKDGLWGLLMTELSRAIGTEATYADSDLAAAKKGAGFVAVHCPTEALKTEAWKVLEPMHPVVARYYSSGGIEHMVGEL